MHFKRQALSVTELVRYLRTVLEEDEGLFSVWVRGEISNFHHHVRGHMYFTLKDENSRIRAVMFSGNNRRLRFMPRDGDRVLARGYVSVYERDGLVQLYVLEMHPDGVGELYVAFQRLKEKLEAEGLFASELKKPLPFLPRRIGVVTSPGGAAVRDIITTLRRRFPIARILIYPVPVQGEEAPRAIAEALELVNRRNEVDVVIVGRGGGSLEELWAFNEEVVARSIHRSQIPVVSAVGHETDVTISDLVADVRAATPTAAAELVAPALQDLEDRLAELAGRLVRSLEKLLNRKRERLQALKNRPAFRHPRVRLEQQNQRLDQLAWDLHRSFRARLDWKRSELEHLVSRLAARRPAERISALRERLGRLERACAAGMIHLLRSRRALWENRVGKLDSLSPLKVMRRGYSLVYRYGENRLIQSVSEVEPGDLIRVRFADGRIDCQVWGREALSDE
ncbi:Exodeoxyribonuclease VII large subunit [Planifilum fulgidum]|jgi:exodeoxyribonuclease VII large subunit|uniref:Exodeoxyribonuclease 7 large subunit n=1 Tax=Planifilum fulgidum TaxID=201973 RepID=A0A1I2L3C9_9BACL|nr:exodeoxyribonuclease VII large subunit [Planifilum fulgidum]MBO2495825.1 exodeoxyribonuclease VII large subunit [Bacillota bacterium]SFF73715.1 Exodeoxyribonuclease VII large subunit [Planifilum fulgidum]